MYNGFDEPVLDAAACGSQGGCSGHQDPATPPLAAALLSHLWSVGASCHHPDPTRPDQSYLHEKVQKESNHCSSFVDAIRGFTCGTAARFDLLAACAMGVAKRETASSSPAKSAG